MIDEKVLIERLEDLYQPCYLCREDRCAIDRAIEIVKKLAEESNNGWIPCSERLPEEWEYYLVSDGQSTFIAEYADYEWRYHSNEQTKDYVTVSVLAWCELPAPYQPKGE